MKTIANFFTLLFLVTFFCSLDAKSASSYETRRNPHLFPEESCTLPELKKRAEELKADSYKEAQKIIYDMARRILTDKKIQGLKVKSAQNNKTIAGKYHPPFDKNRAGRNFKGLYINASDVRLKRQHFVLAGCPKTDRDVRNYFEAALDQNVAVFVSALKSNEAKTRINNFWKADNVSRVKLRNGATIKNISSRVIRKIEDSKKKIVPQIIETTLVTSNRKTITHLHYEGWRDKRGMPCKELFSDLLDRIYELSPNPKSPVAINCRGGVGRTGTVAVSLYLRREVDAQLLAGKKLDEISVNIPELIYAFRNQRKSIVGLPVQFTQIYSVLNDYYERLKAKQEKKGGVTSKKSVS